MFSRFFPASAVFFGLLTFAGCGPSTTANPASSQQGKVAAPLPTPAANPPRNLPESATIKFTDVTASIGMKFTYKNDSQKLRRSILESVGGGQGMVDFDRDGLLDLFHVGGGFYTGRDGKELGGYPSVLYRNRGDWKFENISVAAGGFEGNRYKHGCSAADYDNDGFQDLLVCGYGGVQFWRNMGDGSFQEGHAPAGLLDALWSVNGAWGDFNRDGFLDVYVAHYVNWSFENDPPCAAVYDATKRESCPPGLFKGLPDTLYLSNGDGSFRDYSKEAGLRLDGKGLAAITCDLDMDGDQDIYVCNDTVENFLYLNDGTGKFVEDAGIRGCATDHKGNANGSMGVDIGDYNHDGLPDIWVANYERESFALYQNEGDAFFRHSSEPLGITAIGGVFVGFGTVFADLNRDSFEDIVVNNGHVQFHPQESSPRQPPLLLMNRGGKSFERIHLGKDSYLDTPHVGRGLAMGDLDNDGDHDLGFTNNDEPSVILRNDCNDGNSWLRVRLIGTTSNRDGIGARLALSTENGELLRFVHSGTSYASQSDNRPLWGIPKGSVLKKLTVIWPSGIVQTLDRPRESEEMAILEPDR